MLELQMKYLTSEKNLTLQEYFPEQLKYYYR
jgi:hypothetical protein